MTRLPLRVALVLGLGAGLGAQPGAAQADDGLLRRARVIHERVLTIDTHADIPFDYATEAVNPCRGTSMQVDIPKMKRGGLDAAFFVVYVGQMARTAQNYRHARAQAMTKFMAIRRMTERLCPEAIELADTAKDVERIHAEGKRVALIGIENGFVIGKDLGLLRRYRDLGARYMTLAHGGHNDIADSATPRLSLGDRHEEHGGLSPFGEQVVAEMNRLGIVVDVSHVSRNAMMDAVLVSRAPVMASHSSVRALRDHPRNMDDEQLEALRANGGVIQIVAYGNYLRRVVEGARRPSVRDLVDHIDHAVSVAGIDHVGISSDFDGGGGIRGWTDASETLNVTVELVRRGYAEEDIRKLWGGNVLRVLRENEEISEHPQSVD